MASVASLGIHKPSAVPYLVAEGILPADPAENTYTWQTAPIDENGQCSDEEELLITRHCVVWSRGGTVHRIFRFDVEKESVTQALFAYFPPDETSQVDTAGTAGWRQTGELHDVEIVAARGLDVSESTTASEGRSPAVDESSRMKHSICISENLQRTLVIALESQLHLFILSGTSHVVPLPFQIETAYPLPRGILVRKKSPIKSDDRAKTPAPTTTLLRSQASTASLNKPSYSFETSAGLDPMTSRLLYKISHVSAHEAALSSPNFYCLLDPLSQLGIVAVRKTATCLSKHGTSSTKLSSYSELPCDEQLLYTSIHDECDTSGAVAVKDAPLLFAITEDRKRGMVTVWTVSYLDFSSQVSMKTSSSHGHAVSTGRAASHVQGSALARQAIDTSRSFRQSGCEASRMDAFSIVDASEPLDPAFEDPSKPAKTSRRVSSLLARADLSANIERNVIGDGQNPQLRHTNRRAASLGRTDPLQFFRIESSDQDDNLLQPVTQARLRLGLEAESPKDYIGTTDDHTTLHDFDSANISTSPDLCDKYTKEIIFHKVHSIKAVKEPLSCSENRMNKVNTRVIVMRAPAFGLAEATNEDMIVVWILDKSSAQLSTLQILRSAQCNTRSQASNSAHQDFCVQETTTSNVSDIIKIGERGRWRVLILASDTTGNGTMSLEAPWSVPLVVGMPDPLTVHNPHQAALGISVRQHGEGGLHRVFRRLPHGLVGLQNASADGQVDVIDSEQHRHRIVIHLRPSDPSVSKVIDVCEIVFSALAPLRETVLRIWWDVITWLRAQPGQETDMEWLATNITLFTLATPFLPTQTHDTKHLKRRKGPLLRSSSGANTDLDSWMTMVHHEDGSAGPPPTWTGQGAWQWLTSSYDFSITDSVQVQQCLNTPANYGVSSSSKSLTYLQHCKSLSYEFLKSSVGRAALGDRGYLPASSTWSSASRRSVLPSTLIALHLLREESKLDTLASDIAYRLTPILAQLGGWLGWPNWSFHQRSTYMLEGHGIDQWLFDDSTISTLDSPEEPFPPPSILRYVEEFVHDVLEPTRYPLLSEVTKPSSNLVGKISDMDAESRDNLIKLTPRTILLIEILNIRSKVNMEDRIAEMASHGLEMSILETLPEGVAIQFRSALAACQADPSASLNNRCLAMLDRDDIAMIGQATASSTRNGRASINILHESMRDVHNICQMSLDVEAMGPYDGHTELDRQAITRLIFKDDQRFAEAAKLLHPLISPVARCVAEPEWSDTDFLEAQQELAKVIAIRTLAVSLGRGLMFYNARLPLLTDRYPIHGFTLSCVMRPGDVTVTADRTIYTEEKVSWAFFHAGAEAGLSITRESKGIDTSWILFNKPRELNNRHAGFLLAMGLNRHLKHIAKWVAFKYLTPKHSMTSVGLLLGLSASYMGTMDSLITRLLSVHVTRMLPLGAAELNISPLTQTSGLMGIGLLYCNTQHRRMSEIMLSEMENENEEDGSIPLRGLRDEGYRLAAGFGLGFINLGQGADLKGLHDMQITERLLSLSVGYKKADRVHILDRATAGAIMAVALVFLKTQHEAVARKIDIPGTVHQFENLRPDHFLLRTVARHLIMWNNIHPTMEWMQHQLPCSMQSNVALSAVRVLTSEDLPCLNIIAGLCLSIGLRHAGSGCHDSRDLLCHYLTQYMRICRLPTLNYDAKLARITVRNCQDLVALAASCVMAGTGDLQIFRRLRSLHGRTDAEIPYGSHLASHYAIGILFLGGGSHTFGTSNIAVASLLCAFYPLFPSTVLDNRSHLQAFRHFWVLATEHRCLVARDVDTLKPISLPISVISKQGKSTAMIAPCLVPELDTIAQIQVADPEYWQVTLDFTKNPAHLSAFERHQSIYVRRRAAYDAHASVFNATMHALHDSQLAAGNRMSALGWIFSLPVFTNFDKPARAITLPSHSKIAEDKGPRCTVIDDKLVLEHLYVDSNRGDRLWSLRLLLAWADTATSRIPHGWLEIEFIERLRVAIGMRRRQNRSILESV